MEYFHVGIFVIPGVCLIRKYGSRNTAFFLYFSPPRGAVIGSGSKTKTKMKIAAQPKKHFTFFH